MRPGQPYSSQRSSAKGGGPERLALTWPPRDAPAQGEDAQPVHRARTHLSLPGPPGKGLTLAAKPCRRAQGVASVARVETPESAAAARLQSAPPAQSAASGQAAANGSRAAESM